MKADFLPKPSFLFALSVCFLLLGCSHGNRTEVNRPLKNWDVHGEHPLYLVVSVQRASETMMQDTQKAEFGSYPLGLDRFQDNPNAVDVWPGPARDGASRYSEQEDLLIELLALRLMDSGLWEEVLIAPFKPGAHRKIWQQATFLELKTVWSISGDPGAQKVQFISTGIMDIRPIEKVIWQGNISTTEGQKKGSPGTEDLIKQATGKHVQDIIDALGKG